jgi:hypothetical protein
MINKLKSFSKRSHLVVIAGANLLYGIPIILGSISLSANFGWTKLKGCPSRNVYERRGQRNVNSLASVGIEICSGI